RGPAWLAGVPDREVAVRVDTVIDAVGADDACVPDVEDARAPVVQLDPEPDEEDRRGDHGPHGQRGPRARTAVPRPDPGEADDEVDEREGRERRAREDVTVVEVPERNGEREQCEQVDVSHA